jgi:4'-phosphopantetheinyl transferase EntD
MRLLAELLDGLPIVTREGDPRVVGPIAEVWPEERAAVERAVAKRRNEYFATRHLARLALTELAVPGCPILNNPDRSPRWPRGVVGSLSHTDTWCGVALTRQIDGICGLGIDLERVGSVSSEVEQRISSARELSASDSTAASLRFSAKEALYKAIFPFVNRFVGFLEVEIHLDDDRRAFTVRPMTEELTRELSGFTIRGVCALQAGLCCCAVVLKRK